MRKRNAPWVILVVILLAAFLLNPGKSKHLDEIFPPSPLIPRTGFEELIKYHNYYLFSTTTDVFTGERHTFGILGFVFR